MNDPDNAGNWAQPVELFHIEQAADGARTGNVEGRRPSGPLQGFGQLWEKSYEVPIPGHTPEEIIGTWKERFGDFWYPSNKFYAPVAGISPGEIAVISGGRGPARINTGVRVIYADERSWSYMNPEGHPWAGIITFSAHEDDESTSRARIHLFVRANDPLYEAGFMLYGSRLEDKIWSYTLTRLAEHFGSDQPVSMSSRLIDRKRQWKQFGNIWKNSMIRTLFHRDRRDQPSRGR